MDISYTWAAVGQHPLAAPTIELITEQVRSCMKQLPQLHLLVKVLVFLLLPALCPWLSWILHRDCFWMRHHHFRLPEHSHEPEQLYDNTHHSTAPLVENGYPASSILRPAFHTSVA